MAPPKPENIDGVDSNISGLLRRQVPRISKRENNGKARNLRAINPLTAVNHGSPQTV